MEIVPGVLFEQPAALVPLIITVIVVLIVVKGAV